MSVIKEQDLLDFHHYPPIGDEDWRYGYETALVRVLEGQMMAHGTMLDIANAETFSAAIELLAGSDYAMGSSSCSLGDVEAMLLEKRSEVRRLFVKIILDEEIAELLAAREDFANMRLAVRRVVTEKPIGLDYSNEGSVPAEEFEDIFEQENYSMFPMYLQEAVEEAVLGYYVDKDIRQIDYGIDRVQFAYKLRRARELESMFLMSLFKTQIDLTNIRTALRLKFAEKDSTEARPLLIEGGFVEIDKYMHIFDIGYEAIAPLFYTTSYHNAIEAGVSYLAKEQSFLRLEEECQDYLMDFLKTTLMLTAGPQPVIAYFLLKENEIRTLRMLLTCKMNGLDMKLILDRLGES